ncbi:uncharacterized protein STEHIDRAFT_150071, partial [Stereum hirsutum FP-91666 SS1]|uniref:uncharacterized protein n=1 Tax=Stereum hirsutum (strain FP-91666) TaxID=721885 RepID=UPI0004449BCC
PSLPIFTHATTTNSSFSPTHSLERRLLIFLRHQIPITARYQYEPSLTSLPPTLALQRQVKRRGFTPLVLHRIRFRLRSKASSISSTTDDDAHPHSPTSILSFT